MTVGHVLVPNMSCVWAQTKVALCLLSDEGGDLVSSVALIGRGLLGRCPDVCRTPLLILTLRFLTSPICFCTAEFSSPSRGLESFSHTPSTSSTCRLGRGVRLDPSLTRVGGGGAGLGGGGGGGARGGAEGVLFWDSLETLLLSFRLLRSLPDESSHRIYTGC